MKNEENFKLSGRDGLGRPSQWEWRQISNSSLADETRGMKIHRPATLKCVWQRLHSATSQERNPLYVRFREPRVASINIVITSQRR